MSTVLFCWDGCRSEYKRGLRHSSNFKENDNTILSA